MPRTAGKRCLSNLQLGPGELVWEMWDRTSSKPPDRNLTCCPSPTRSPSRSQVEICLSSLSWWCPGSASRSSPLVNSPGQSRRRGPPTEAEEETQGGRERVSRNQAWGAPRGDRWGCRSNRGSVLSNLVSDGGAPGWREFTEGTRHSDLTEGLCRPSSHREMNLYETCSLGISVFVALAS